MSMDALDADNSAHIPIAEITRALYTYDVIDSLAPLQTVMRNLLQESAEQIALVTIHLQFGQVIRPDLAVHSTAHLLDNLRVLVRRTDHVFLHEHTMYFVLRGCNQQGAAIVQARLWEALLWRVHNLNGLELPHPRSMDIGHSGYQEQQASVERCIEAARAWQLHFERHAEKPRKSPRQSQAESIPATDSPEDDLPALARKLGIPYLSLLPRKLPVNLQRLVTPSLAQELHCFPLGREHDTLTVAMLNPGDHSALARLRAATGLQIFPVLVPPQALQSALEQLA